MNNRTLSRRDFVKLASLAAAGTLAHSSGALAAGQKLGAIGIQLYTVRQLMAKSVPATLTALSALGYKEVEFAGYYNTEPAQLKSLLAGAGLVSPSTHIDLEQIKNSLEQTMDSAAEIGHDYVVLAYLSERERASLDHYKSYVELFSRAGEAAKSRGMHFGYHNHHFEFAPLEDVVPYDFMLQQIDGDLMKMTMDLYWINRAGQDPLAYFERFPGRFKQCHVKDMGTDGAITDVGAGIINFARIFARAEQAGFEHYYVEHDTPKDALVSASNSIDYLQKLFF